MAILGKKIVTKSFKNCQNGDKSPHLVTLLLVITFRGDETDFGSVKSDGPGRTETDAIPTSPRSPEKDPSFEDMLIANATIDGYVANRCFFCLIEIEIRDQ